MKRRRPFGGALGEAVTSCGPVAPRHAVRVCVTRPNKPGPVIRSPEDVFRVLRGAENADRESFYAIHLDSGNHVVGVEEVAKGSIGRVETHPREIFKAAILSNARAIIIAHNHPSGDPTPSSEDIGTTHRLVDAGKLVGIPVIDHVIVGADRCNSLSASGAAQFSGASARNRKRRRK